MLIPIKTTTYENADTDLTQPIQTSSNT